MRAERDDFREENNNECPWMASEIAVTLQKFAFRRLFQFVAIEHSNLLSE